MKWYRGHTFRFWPKLDHRTWHYIKQPITDEEVKMWENQGYDYIKSFTGSAYNDQSLMPSWMEKFKEVFPQYTNFAYCVYKMQTLEIMPTHVDHYRRYREVFNVESKDVVRILVMLEDWQPGHYLEIGNVGITNWIAGDYFVWENDVPHAASNIGIEDRYTLQITATKKDIEYRFDDDLHWFNLGDVETKPVSMNEFNLKTLLPALENNEGKPFFFYEMNSKIHQLEDLKLSEGTRSWLNQHGVDVYLNEPLCSYLEGAEQYFPPFGTKHSLLFYSEFVGNENVDDLRCDELDSVMKFMDNNDLINVRIHSCDYDIEKYYPYYANYMELYTHDIFLKTISMHKGEEGDVDPIFTKKFMCLNWRYTPHRHMIAAYVATMPVHLSWYFRSDLATMGKTPWFDIYKWQEEKGQLFHKILEGVNHLNRFSPLNVDLNIEQAYNITNPYFREVNPLSITMNEYQENSDTSGVKNYYLDVFCDIVTESRFAQPTANYSEKTYQPMLYKKPFVLAAPNYTLKYLREQGFKTFGDFWDESYDEIENNEERLIAIFKVIDSINEMSYNELRDMYVKMRPILDHNFQLLQEKIYKVK